MSENFFRDLENYIFDISMQGLTRKIKIKQKFSHRINDSQGGPKVCYNFAIEFQAEPLFFIQILLVYEKQRLKLAKFFIRNHFEAQGPLRFLHIQHLPLGSIALAHFYWALLSSPRLQLPNISSTLPVTSKMLPVQNSAMRHLGSVHHEYNTLRHRKSMISRGLTWVSNSLFNGPTFTRFPQGVSAKEVKNTLKANFNSLLLASVDRV